MMSERIYLASPHMGGSERRYVDLAFDTNWIAPLGANVTGFEQDLQQYLGAGYVTALSAGTAALHLAVRLAGVQRGDRVFCQSLTFSASANPIVYEGGEPVFLDSEPDTWNLDPETVEAAIARFGAPKALIAVHLYGMPGKLDAIRSLCDAHGILLIEDAAEALALTIGSVDHVGAGLGTAGVNADIGELTDERVGHDLEGQSGERRGIVRGAVLDLVRLGHGAGDRRDVQRGRHIIDDGVQQLLHTLILIGRAAHDRDELDLRRGLANGRSDLFGGHLLTLKIQLHDLVVEIGDRLNQLRAVLFSLVAHILGDLLDAHILAEIVVVDVRLHIDQVDDAAEICLSADRQLDRNSIAAQAIMHHVHNVVEVRAHDVHLVDVDHAGNIVMVSLSPDRLGLRLHAALGTKDRHAAVEHAQAALDLNGEIDVARGVDDVDAVTLPEASGRSARDRDAALLLLRHPVHGGGAFMGLTELVVDARVEQNAFRRGRLTGVDVRHDANVSCVFKGILSGHN